jgi:hypothetical protein
MSPIDNLADRLARVQSAFDAAPVGFDNQPPDGDYQTLVHDFDFFQGGTPRRAYSIIPRRLVASPRRSTASRRKTASAT